MIIEIDLKFVLWYKCIECKKFDTIPINSKSQLVDAIYMGHPLCDDCGRELDFDHCEMTT